MKSKLYILLILIIIGVLFIWLRGNKIFIPASTQVKTQVQTTVITQKQALDMVSNLPEVKDFVARVKQNHGDPHVAVSDATDTDESGVHWSVQVYENLSDHNSTFAWYQVYVKDGKIVNINDQTP